jgi:hypothetical protein
MHGAFLHCDGALTSRCADGMMMGACFCQKSLSTTRGRKTSNAFFFGRPATKPDCRNQAAVIKYIIAVDDDTL